jgi:MFS family permease
VFGFSWQPIGNGLVAYYTPPKWRGYAYSISFALSFGVGALASSIAGRIADHYGLARVFIVMAGIGLASFFFSIPLWILNRRAEKG